MAGIITIDGSQGEGGGQVLRSSLALSLVTGRPLVIEQIRAGRKKPGLLRQHLTAVLAAAEISGADVEGAALVNRLGPRVEVRLVRPGFYPAAGGQFTVRVQPAEQLGRLELVHRGPIVAQRVRAMVANLPRHIAECECQTIAQETGWHESSFSVDEVKGSRGPGNVVMIELEAEHVTEVFTGFGERGVRAEDVAMQALREAEGYLAAGVPVGTHLADQLMLPLGIGAYLGSGGGMFRTMQLSLHSTTHLEILRRFLEIDHTTPTRAATTSRKTLQEIADAADRHAITAG